MASNDDNLKDDGLGTLTEAVKSRILDRVLAELRADIRLGSGMNGYTKSDSGIYGKYQKQDVDLATILAAIKSETERILAEYEVADRPRDDDSLE